MKTTKKYKSVEEFFEEPIPQYIEDEVNCQVRIIDTAIEFGEWLNNSTFINIAHGEGAWWCVKTHKWFTTSQLWQKFLNEKEEENEK